MNAKIDQTKCSPPQSMPGIDALEEMKSTKFTHSSILLVGGEMFSGPNASVIDHVPGKVHKLTRKQEGGYDVIPSLEPPSVAFIELMNR